MFATGPTGKRIAALPPDQQRAFEDDVASEAERYRKGRVIQLGGVTRLVVARPEAM